MHISLLLGGFQDISVLLFHMVYCCLPPYQIINSLLGHTMFLIGLVTLMIIDQRLVHAFSLALILFHGVLKRSHWLIVQVLKLSIRI